MPFWQYGYELDPESVRKRFEKEEYHLELWIEGKRRSWTGEFGDENRAELPCRLKKQSRYNKAGTPMTEPRFRLQVATWRFSPVATRILDIHIDQWPDTTTRKLFTNLKMGSSIAAILPPLLIYPSFLYLPFHVWGWSADCGRCSKRKSRPIHTDQIALSSALPWSSMQSSLSLLPSSRPYISRSDIKNLRFKPHLPTVSFGNTYYSQRLATPEVGSATQASDSSTIRPWSSVNLQNFFLSCFFISCYTDVASLGTSTL